MTDEAIQFGDQNLRYKLKQWNKTGAFGIMNNISKYVTLVQLMDSLGNMNHAVSMIVVCIFESNYEKEMTLNIYSLNLICTCSDEEE